MPKIVAAAAAMPGHVYPQDNIKEALSRLLAHQEMVSDRVLSIFGNSRIRQRQFMMPLEWYLSPRSAAERNKIYREKGLELVLTAARDCLAKAGCKSVEIDAIIFVSSTGIATPTIDTHIINELGMKPSVVRLPLWGLGCAAGVAALARACDYCLGHPGARVLAVALECCSLNFIETDKSKKNLVAASLFADGAAVALVVGSEVPMDGPRYIANRSHLFADSYRIMGWDVDEDGLNLVLSPKLPAIVRRELPPLVGSFLTDCGLSLRNIAHYITHPGGARVIDAYRDALGLYGEELMLTEEALALHGNISSVSVLVALEMWLHSGNVNAAGYVLMSGFGPGFSAELLLLKV
jgi:alkylresorcinol/alkylpyrone synthase